MPRRRQGTEQGGRVVTEGDRKRVRAGIAADASGAPAGAVLPAVFRLLRSVGSLLAAALGAVGLCLFLMKAIAGGPFRSEQLSDPVLLANLDAAFGLATPWWQQWVQWCAGAVQGSLGTSFQHRGVEVTTLLASAWPVSVLLGAFALALGLALAVPSGVLVARARFGAAGRRSLASWWPTSLAFGAFCLEALMGALLCIPTYVSAPLMLVAAAGLTELPPVASAGDGVLRFTQAALVLAMPVAAVAYRWILLGLAEAASAPWWTAIRARRLSERRRWWRYALASVWPLLAGRLAPLAAELLLGSLAVELVFGLPGLGQLLGAAALHRDTPVLLGAVACSVVTVRGAQALADAWTVGWTALSLPTRNAGGPA